jgi:hypothetical protein
VRSDIDLLVIYDDPPRDDAFRIVKKTIPLQGVEPHLFTVKEAEERSDLIERMTKTSEVVFRADQEKRESKVRHHRQMILRSFWVFNWRVASSL